jgi:tRNA pseudouridine55 synthase
MNGILNVNKTRGKTSFGIVALIRRLSGERRVGHAGTLDPEATGVLPICLGQATRVVEFLADATKTYRAEIELGIATDTYDSTGTITQRGDISGIGREQVEVVLESFRGQILQTPPMYSAVKHQGKPLYQLARAGIIVERRQRRVEVYGLDVTAWQPPVITVEVVCSKGTYIRSLAHDIGQVLGCGASVRSLIRLRCGTFGIEEAVSVPELEDAFHGGYWQQLLYPMDSVLTDWRWETVSEEMAQVIRNGRPVELTHSLGGDREVPSDSVVDTRCRVYSPDGRLLSLMKLDTATRQWQPVKVFQ